jgi:hypothetical protein
MRALRYARLRAFRLRRDIEALGSRFRLRRGMGRACGTAAKTRIAQLHARLLALSLGALGSTPFLQGTKVVLARMTALALLSLLPE